MITRTLHRIFPLVLLLSMTTAAIIAASILPKTAGATIATACPMTDQDVRAACEDGYRNGTGQGNVCIQYRSQGQNGAAKESACRDGYNSYVADFNSCTGTVQTYHSSSSPFASIPTSLIATFGYTPNPGDYVNPPNAQPKTDAQCEQELRSQSNNNQPAPTPSPSDNPGDPSNRKIGPVPTDADISKRQNDEKAESRDCGIEGFFGKTVCGITIIVAKVADGAFHMLSAFLETPPILTQDANGQDSSVYTAWSLFRGFANVLFVMALLVTIYAYVTGAGISNYNIKRIIPRLIVASILVNFSFYICSIAVDLANILGATLKDTIVDSFNGAVNTDGELLQSGYGTWESVASSTLLVGAGVALAGAAVLFASFSVLAPILLSAILAIITAVFVLMLRQVLILLFIIISPLAFAAIILPNTSSWFDKWRTMFVPIVMLYPAISLIYGGSYVASMAIQRTAIANGDTILTIMSLGIQVIPLFLTPIIMKLGGSLLQQVGQFTQSRGKALIDKSKFAETLAQRRDLKAVNYNPSTLGKARLVKRARVGVVRGRLDREQRNKQIDKNLEHATGEYVSERAHDDTPTLGSKLNLPGAQTKGDKFARQIAQSKDNTLTANAKNQTLHAKAKAHAKAVEAKAVEDRGMTRDDAIAAATAEQGVVSELTREAAILRLCQAGDIGAILQLVKSSYKMNQQERRTLVENLRKNGVGEKIPFLGNQEALDAIEQHGVSESTFSSSVVAPSLATDDYSASTYADIDQDGALEVSQTLGKAVNGDVETIRALGKLSEEFKRANANASQEQINKELERTGREALRDHQQAAYDALTNEETSLRVAQGRKHLERIAEPIISHEEALVQNALYDAERRGDS